MVKRAVIVLSGGLDSATCLGIAHEQGYDLYALTFDYGQRHEREVEMAKKLARHYQVSEHRIVNLDFLKAIGGSALTDEQIEVPDEMAERNEAGLEESDENEAEIPVTYVPARNLIFLSLATAWAEVVQAEKIMIGVSAVDFSGYPDCRPEFIESMNQTVQRATKAGFEEKGIKIEAPLIDLSKAETVKLGVKLGVPYHLTTSCYEGKALACGHCDSCRLRIKGFKEAGLVDPVPYSETINW